MYRSLGFVSHGGLSLEEVAYEGGWFQRRHAHDELSLSLLLEGGLVETVASRPAHDAGPFAAGIKPAGLEHADRYATSGARILCVKIAREWAFEAADEMTPPWTWGWAPAGPAVPAFMQLLRRLRHDRATAHAWLEDAVCELAAGIVAGTRDAAPGLPPAFLMRVREHLLDTFDRGVRTRQLAADVDMHPAALARAFRRHFGESMSECVRRRRLEVTLCLLGRGQMSLTDVAGRAGFADQSHLTRFCRQEAGLTPAALRKLLACSDRSRRGSAVLATFGA